MRAQERAPGRRPLTARRKAFGLEDARNRRPGNTMPDVLQRPLDPRVSPLRIVGRHAHHETPNLLLHARSPWALAWVRPFPGDQLPVPSQNRVGRDERRELAQHAATKALAEHRETPALVVIQSQSPAAQLHFQHAVLFAEEGDHIALLAFEPSKQRGQQHLQRNHPSTLRYGLTDAVFGQYAIRIFLQDGSNDLDNNWGNWFLANQQMLKAFEFANSAADARKDTGPRYDVKREWGDGAHSDDHFGALLPDALRWLFRDRRQ